MRVGLGLLSWLALAVGVWLAYFVITVADRLNVWPL